MSYQALYRVWRPQRFDEIVGQQVVTQTLKNAIITKQISHAYYLPDQGELARPQRQKSLLKPSTVIIGKTANPAMNARSVGQLLMDSSAM